MRLGFTVLGFFVLCSVLLPAQQPNHPNAVISINGAFAGPPYPIQVGGLPGGVATLLVRGGPQAAGMPFALAYGPVIPGTMTNTYGSVDLDVFSPVYGLAFNGWDNAFPTYAMSFLGPQAAFTFSAYYEVGYGVPTGIQGLVADPTIPNGARLTAAVDFTPTTGNPLNVNLAGGGAPLWQNNGGVINVPATCPPAVFLNQELTIHFGGLVYLSSLPAPGPASGSINISTGGVPAEGTFVVRDDPRLPAGNNRLVSFYPNLPSSLSCTAGGFLPDSIYTIDIPSSGPNLVIVDGSPITQGVLACFSTSSCNPQNPAESFRDPVEGSPQVTSVTPPMGNPAPPPIPAASIANDTISLAVSEYLIPETVSLSSVRLINETIGTQVPGQVVLTQSPAFGQTGTLAYQASVPFVPGSVYRLEVSPTVTDIAGNTLELIPGSPGTPLFLQIQAQVPVPQAPITETFANANNAGQITGPLTWGGGALSMTYSSEIVGTGAFGPLVIAPGPTTLDTGAAPSTGFANGVWDTSSVAIAPGAMVRLVGPYPVHLKSTTTVDIAGNLRGSAGADGGAPLGSPEQGPGFGNFNNGGTASGSIVAGGVGGPGAGDGGRASQEGFSNRTLMAEAGFGPRIEGQANRGPFGANDGYGGGAGGVGGYRFPAGGVAGELGGLGGAGGSAFEQGDDGSPHTSVGAGCTPFVPVFQPVAAATPVPAAFVAPISAPTAGSGGGGGGDRFELSGPFSDDQGGGGAGGGGGLRVTSRQDLTIATTAVITMNGANGGAGNVFFGGGGGGGSGGLIWLQSLANVVISTSAEMVVDGGSGGNTCGDHHSGKGGVGLYQIEDDDGIANTFFSGPPVGANNVVVLPVMPMGSVGTASSVFLDTGFGNPTFTSALASFSNGATGQVVITYQGAQPSLNNPAVPDPATITNPVLGSQVSSLSGHRFIRFTATLSYPPFPTTLPTTPLPMVTNIAINYDA